MLEVAENETQRARASSHCALVQELMRFGLCSAFDVAEADHEREQLDQTSHCLAAALDDLKAQGSSSEAQKAKCELQKATLEVQIAEIRNNVDAKRQRLLCEAAQLEHVEPARRRLDLTNRRIEALGLRAQRAGFVLCGDQWDPWERKLVAEKVSRGSPIYYGQTVASIVDTAHLRVRAKIREQEILGLARGDKADVSFDAIPGKTYGFVFFCSKAIAKVDFSLFQQKQYLLKILFALSLPACWIVYKEVSHVIFNVLKTSIILLISSSSRSACGISLRHDLPSGTLGGTKGVA